jgi:hypothetical protein
MNPSHLFLPLGFKSDAIPIELCLRGLYLYIIMMIMNRVFLINRIMMNMMIIKIIINMNVIMMMMMMMIRMITMIVMMMMLMMSEVQNVNKI